MVRSLEVIKVPRKDPIPDYPINFPPLENLHLDLLENKKKLKPGLPLIPQARRRQKPKPLPPPSAPPRPLEPPKQSLADVDDDDMVAALGHDTSVEHEETHEIPGEVPMQPRTTDPVEEALGAREHDTSGPESEGSGTEGSEGLEEMDEETAFCEGMPPEEKEIFNEMTSQEKKKYMVMTPEQRERYQKEVYIWKWTLLKRSYPARKDLPEFNEHSDFHIMKTSYERTLRDLQLDDNIESYRTYLVFGWIGMEYACTQWMGIDLSGFTVSQTKMMYKYEKLLIELGERPYSKWGTSLQVEVRILGLILIQAGIFYLAKILSNKFGSTVADLFKGITGQPPVPSGGSEGTPKPPKRRMRGPRTKAEDIRNINRDE